MLTDIKIRKLSPQSKPYKETDGKGLYLEVRPTGAKFFRYRYRHPLTKKEQVYTIGEYPAISLKDARQLRDEAKELLVRDVDPAENKKTVKETKKKERARKELLDSRPTFNDVFQLWHKTNSSSWRYEYSKDIRERVEKHCLPYIGDMYADEIKPKDLINMLKKLEIAGMQETLKRIRQYAGRIFRFGVGMGMCERDPTRDLPTDIFQKQQKENFSHLVSKSDLYQLLNAIDQYCGDYSTKMALKVAPHVFLRPKELAWMKWDEVDFDSGLINIPAERMKKGRPHVVPMSKQVKAFFEELSRYSGDGIYVFPSPRAKMRHMSEQSLNAGLHRIGFSGKQTAHGFRHTASTLLNEMGFNGDHIEKQLAHEQGNKIRGTYNKAEYLKDRMRMMQAWSDHLDSLKRGADVIPIKAKRV